VLDFASNQGYLDDNHSSYSDAGSLGSGGLAALVESKLGIEVAKGEKEVAILSPGFLVSSTREFLDTLPNSSPSDGSSGLIFRPTPDMEPSISRVPVFEAKTPDFDSSLYGEALATRVLGQVAVYVPCVGSTQLTLEKLVCHGATVVAGRQTQGKGRGGNAWLSPLGCCMFSTQMLVLPGKVLAARPSIVQHLVALAVVQAVSRTTGVKLSIKWPNDIYLSTTVAETRKKA